MRTRKHGSRRRAMAGGALAALLATTACSGTDCSFDDCPDVPAAEAGHVTGTDPTGVVRWTATVADLLSEPLRLSNGHVLVIGCRSTHVVDVASGAVTTTDRLDHLIGIVGGYAVGSPADDTDDDVVAAQPLLGGSGASGGAGGWSWSVSPTDTQADRAYRSSAVTTSRALVGVRDRTLHAWFPAGGSPGSWEDVEVPLPVGSWRNERLVAVDATHVVVPGSDGSVLGVDLGTRAVTWRSMPTRPDAPAGTALRLDAGRVVAEVWYPLTRTPAATGDAVWVTEQWSVDPSTGAVVSGRTTTTRPRPRGDAALPSASLSDPVTGWTFTPRMREQPRGGCF